MLYDYEIVSGSTYAVDQQTQQQNLAGLLTLFQQSQTPQGNMLIEQLKQDGFNFNFGELLKRIISNSGVQDWDKILTEQSQDEKNQAILAQHAQIFQQAIQQQPQLNAAVQQMNANPNQTPAQPSMQQPQGQPVQQPQIQQGMPPQMGGMR